MHSYHWLAVQAQEADPEACDAHQELGSAARFGWARQGGVASEASGGLAEASAAEAAAAEAAGTQAVLCQAS